MAGLRRCTRGFPAILIMFPRRDQHAGPGRRRAALRTGLRGRGRHVDPADGAAGRAPPAADALEVRADGRSVPVTGVVTYALDGGPGLVAVQVLFDALPPGQDDGREADAAAALRERLTRPGVLLGVAGCGPDGADVPRPGGAAAAAWGQATAAPVAAGTRLWDGLLAALTAVSGDDLPDRRIVLLVTDGREEIASRHVSASCIEGALRARVPVYVLSLARGPHREADEARLREVADATGGRCVSIEPGADAATTADAAARLVKDLAAVRGLQLAADDESLPLDLTVREAGAEGAGAAGTLARRRSLQAPGRGRWLILAGGLLAMAGAALVLWRQRNVTVGELVVSTTRGDRRFPIPRHGATIGGDPENALVLQARTVSGHHAVIRVQRGEVVLTDLRSAHGTTVNGEPVVTRTLRHGDRILMGRDVALVFRDPRRGGD